MAFEYTKPKFHMGAKITHNDTEKFIQSVPGPGAHSPTVDASKNKAAVYSMGAKLGSSLVTKTYAPGPGAYVNEAHKMKQSAPSFGFGTSKRPDIAGPQKHSSPGPGAYKIPTKISDAPQFALPNKQEIHKFV